MYYRVYGKKKSDNRFKAFDMKKNVFVNNLIHASFFEQGQLDALEDEVNAMNALNPEYVFEIRKTN